MTWHIEGEHIVHTETDYDIPLEQMRIPDLHDRWIAHLAEKRWATEQVLQDLHRALWGQA